MRGWNLSVALAAAGVIVLARSVRLMTKFGAASEIPAWFVEKNVRLRGCVRRVTETGLQVEHVPIRVPLLSPLLGKRHVDGLLDVRLAGVDVAEEGRAWLRQNLMATDMVWLRLIRREADTVDCLVSVSRNMLLNTCVNEELLRLGLGKTVPITGLHYRSRLYWGLHKRLLRAEAQAERRGRGLWKRQSVWTRMMEATSRTAVARLFRKLLRRP
ncbi:protein C3orf33 homolog isoform X2 [Scleropages formosus]|uniref:protein C3orf33 homolog isoform X2 n=1 Tax=Scleropages formosus TaxID=113540 RepID=UPI000878E0FD|nr:protein C3orf33 homolog isoform X2 [Scleropages formosus]